MKRILLMLAIVLGIFAVAAPVSAQTDPLNEACTGNAASSPVCQDRNPGSNPLSDEEGIIVRAARLLSIIVGIASVIVILIGGFKYVTSQGDSNSVASAKQTIIYAIVGLVVALTAQGIIVFVINNI